VQNTNGVNHFVPEVRLFCGTFEVLWERPLLCPSGRFPRNCGAPRCDIRETRITPFSTSPTPPSHPCFPHPLPPLACGWPGAGGPGKLPGRAEARGRKNPPNRMATPCGQRFRG